MSNMKYIYEFNTSRSNDPQTISSTLLRTKDEMETYIKSYGFDCEITDIRETEEDEGTSFINLVKQFMR